MDEILSVEAVHAYPSVNKFSSCYKVDKDGVVKYDYQETDGSIVTKIEQAYAGQWNPARNISKVHHYTTGTTTTTGQVFTSGGTLIPGIIIR